MDVGPENPRTLGQTKLAARAIPLSARAVADGAMDLTPSVAANEVRTREGNPPNPLPADCNP